MINKPIACNHSKASDKQKKDKQNHIIRESQTTIKPNHSGRTKEEIDRHTNSYNFNTVANGCTIEFLAPAHEGDVLTAVAHERSQVGRNANYDVEVRNQDGVTIAHFRGKSTRIKGEVVE